MRWDVIGGAVAIGLLATGPVGARVDFVAPSGCGEAVGGCEARGATTPDGAVLLAQNTATAQQQGSGQGGALIGAALGAIIAGSIVAATDDHSHKSKKHHKKWWSPDDGVKCYDSDQVCYRYGEFAPAWTRREYGW